MNRRISQLFTGAVAAGLVAGLASAPAGAAVTAPVDCPDALPTAQAVDGLTGTGFTVERGTTKDPFTAKVLGRITDGIAPGVDMIMADVDSPALQRAGGVWAGMSGSPVYTADGKLIGSVSYGLAASSPIAGITPAADMKKLLGKPVAGVQARTVKVGTATAKRIAATGEVSAAQASQGFVRIKTPVSVSIPAGAAFDHFTKKAAKRAKDVLFTAAGSRASGEAAPAGAISAGSNAAVTISSGYVTLGGVGTTTFVCDGQAVVFGHPMLWSGATTLGLNAADAVYVQADPLGGPFKVANIGGSAGAVDNDRLTGVHAVLGKTPSTFDITTSITKDGANPVVGRTKGAYQYYADILTGIQTEQAIETVGDKFEGGGTVSLKLTVKGTRANGSPFEVSAANVFTDPDLASFAPSDWAYGIVDNFVYQDFEDVKLTSVDISGDVSETVKYYKGGPLLIGKAGVYTAPTGTVKLTAGKKKYAGSHLTGYRNRIPAIDTKRGVLVPTGTKGLTGTLAVMSADNYLDESSGPSSFEGLLKAIASAPANNQVFFVLSLDGPDGTITKVAHTTVGYPLNSFYGDAPVKVTK